MPKGETAKGQKSKDRHGLTPKERMFADKLLADPDVSLTDAYKAVYNYKNERTASAQASKVHKRKHIQNYLAKRRGYMAQKHTLEMDRIVKELAAIALLDPADFFSPGGQLLPIPEMPEQARRAIAQFETFTEYEGRGADRVPIGETTRIRLIDKNGAIDRATKMLGYNAPEKRVVEDGLSKLLDHIAQNKEGSTIGRISRDSVRRTGPDVRPALAAPQPVQDSGQRRQRGPLPAQSRPDTIVGELLVSERHPESTPVGDDDIS